jgi:hypothetical protein
MSSGQETRKQILPSQTQNPSDFILPSYDFASELATPASIGVSRGDSFESVMNAVKGVAYYGDVIGFGESSNPLTSGMNFQHYGINFFIPSGLRCSNGANMWNYFEGIPNGTGLGKTMQRAMSEMGLPTLRGLAPGILEDSKEALNPQPLLQAALGNVYPVCVEKELPVGDERGSLGRSAVYDDKGEIIIPEQVWIRPLNNNDIKYKDGRPQQKRWVQAYNNKGEPIYISQEEWENTEKTMNPDGTPKIKEGFQDKTKENITLAVAFLTLAFGLACSS